MQKDTISESMLAGRRFEKDPDVCLIYHLLRADGTRIQRDDLADKFAILTHGNDASQEAFTNDIKICADGDSWINILIEVSKWFGYHKTFYDVLENYYNSSSTAWPGDTFEKILYEKSFKVHIDSGVNDFFIFSGGGNDVLGGGALKELLKPKNEGGGSSDPSRYLQLAKVQATLNKLKTGYLEIAEYVRIKSPRTVMLIHGYDYPDAQEGGQWLGKPFEQHQFVFSTDKPLIDSILVNLVDRFYSMLGELERETSNVTLMNLRNVVRGRWSDELHPKREASEDIANVYRALIDGSRAV
ncbi:hypothetical protein IWQ49_005735 [Labrenzia sp. EL_126]|nr:hypothetical protein [Labrenzia sp. EL_126]